MTRLLKHVCRSGNDFEARLPRPETVRGGCWGEVFVRWERHPSAADSDECERRITEAVLGMADSSVELLAVCSLPCNPGVFN